MAPPLIREALHGWMPDIVIGIDFGMTCSGVAWTRIKHDREELATDKKKKRKSTAGELLAAAQVWEPATIQHWGSLRDTQLAGKVPTELIYDAYSGQVTSWGLFCRDQKDRTNVKRLFKLNMSTKATTSEDYGHTTDDARRYFRDYMIKLHDHVERYMTRVEGFEAMRVEYVFSVPTSWKFDTDILQFVTRALREVIGHSQTRRIVIGLSEAAAAAVSVGRRRLSKDDVILVCDIGGGTSDINIVKVVTIDERSVNMQALTFDEGQLVGSTCIDQAARKYVLNQLGEKLDEQDIAAVDKAILGPFQRIKHDYGTAETESQTRHMLYIDDHKLGTIEISDKAIRRWFDVEIEKIKMLTMSQIERLKEGKESKKEKIAMLVLSGGFGQNQYVQDQLKAVLRDAAASKNKAIQADTRVDHVNEPHFAVVRGLVHARVQELVTGQSVFDKVCCRQSYGIVVKEEYSKRKHSNQKGDFPVKSSKDGKLWLYGQIDWIIEEGVLIDSSQVKKAYKWTIPSGEDEDGDWFCEVVTCANPRDHLPRNKDHKSVETVCKITLDMNKLAIEKPKSNIFGMTFDMNKITNDMNKMAIEKTKLDRLGVKAPKLSQAPKVVEFDLVVHIGAADVRFAVHPTGECDTLASLEHDDIEVEWRSSKDWTGVSVSEMRQPIARK